ncbi:MAG: DUF3466 family protein [Patescibacteria group bacterium]
MKHKFVMNAVLAVVMAMSVGLVGTFGQLVEGGELTAGETLEKIVSNAHKIPLELFPPGYLEMLHNSGGKSPYHDTSLSKRGSSVRASQSMLSSSPSLDGVKYVLTDLGTLGSTMVDVKAINNKGQIVGISQLSDGISHRAFLYEDGYMRDLGTLGGSYSAAFGINNQGKVVGHTVTSLNQGVPFIYHNNVMSALEGFASPERHDATAMDINNNGDIVGYYFDQVENHHMFIYNDGQITETYEFMQPYAINNSRYVVGTSDGYPCIYRDGELEIISSESGYAYDVNDAGITVGFLRINPILHEAFVYENGSMLYIPAIGSFTRTKAYAINNHSHVVGSSGSKAFIYAQGQTIDLNTRIIGAGTNWILAEAYSINDLGQIVGEGVNPSGESRAFLLNPIDPQFIPTMTNMPPSIDYGAPFVRETGKSNLIFVTHGAIPAWEDPEDTEAWLDTMTSAVTQYLTTNHLTNWQVVGYKWVEKATFQVIPGRRFGPGYSLQNAYDEGEILGRMVSTQGWSHIHLIAYSAGAGISQSMTEQIRLTSSVPIHSTFLDPFLGSDYEGKKRYGKGADWSDHYFTYDKGTGGNFYEVTQGILPHAYNIDVTHLDTNKKPSGWVISTPDGSVVECMKVKSSHRWPVNFYVNSLSPSTHTNYNGFGFSLSKEGGNWNYALANYVTNNNPAHQLGGNNPICQAELTALGEPTYVNPAMNVSGTIAYVSPTGTIQKSNNWFVATPGSPAWFAPLLNLTNEVNFVSFDARYSGVQGSRNILTVYWDTNIIGQIDEKVVSSESRQYTFVFPRTEGSILHMLGFRVDPYTNVHSSITVSNIVTGLYGPSQPFTLSSTTNTSGGLKVWQLTGQAGFEYEVEVSTNLLDWEHLSTLINTNGSVSFIDRGSTNHAYRFYRAFVPY